MTQSEIDNVQARHLLESTYSGRSGSVPVPTLLTPVQTADTLEAMRGLVEAQRHELASAKHRGEMLSRENRGLRESVKRLERMLARETARDVLEEEAGQLVLRLADEHEQTGDCFGAGVCEACVLASKLKESQ